jgi:hypothetical protein
MLEQSRFIGLRTLRIKKWNFLSPASGVYGVLKPCARWFAKLISVPMHSFTPSLSALAKGFGAR